MRGGAQSHMVAAEDGHTYVVKLKQNAQHRRILINEWVAGVLMRYLQIPSPPMEWIEITPEFLRNTPEFTVTMGSRAAEVAPGFHFGSRVPVDPQRHAIYDFLPDRILQEVANLRDFLGALVFDKWLSNADSRQSIFFRAKVREWSAAASDPRRTAFVAVMIDHGFSFNGPHWTFEDGPLLGLYSHGAVYASATGLDSFQPWLDLAVNVTPDVMDQAFRQIPDFWLNGDREALEKLLEGLWKRRKRIPYLIEDCVAAKKVWFPNWK